MAGLQLSDEEQSERIKAWWKENGTSVIAGLVLGIALIGGVNYWRDYQADQAEAAAALFGQMLAADTDSAGAAGQTLLDDYTGTPYAGKAALLLAKRAIENADLAQAATHLDWAMTQASDPADRDVARLRLAQVALSQDDLQRAEALLAGMPDGSYESAIRELRGDIAMVRDQPGTAGDEYRAALAALPSGSGYGPLLNRKLDAATGASQ